MVKLLKLFLSSTFFIFMISFPQYSIADDLSSVRQELAALKIEVQNLKNEVEQLKASQQIMAKDSKPAISSGKSVCPQCRGTGKRFVICAVCNGTGKETYSCPFCNGKGKNGNNICNACKGKGTMQRTCNSCRSSYQGPETNGQLRRGNFEYCSFCGGSGKR